MHVFKVGVGERGSGFWVGMEAWPATYEYVSVLSKVVG